MFWSCTSNLFACTAILCWDYLNFSYSFYNVTDCSPKSIEILTDKHFVPNNQNISLNNSKSFANGFICSGCTQNNFVKYSSKIRKQCKHFSTRIQLNSFCPNFYRNQKDEDRCQCSPSNTTIERIYEWNQVSIESGKSNLNPRKSQEINRSSSSSVYLLFGFLLFIVLFGGFIGLVSFYIQSKRREK